jgi:WD40 repeat protein
MNHPASADETVQVSLDPDLSTEPKLKLPKPITHPKQVRCVLPVGLTEVGEPYLITGSGDTIRVYDLSTFDKPEMIREVDAHWHDILALRFWIRKSISSDGLTRVEPWIVSTSLDGTIRKWRLSGKLLIFPVYACLLTYLFFLA